MDRTFGVELEVIAPAGRHATLWGRIHSNLMGIGIDARQSGSHLASDYSRWQLKHDGSVRNAENQGGCEVVSPILQGEAGLEALRSVCNAVQTADATVNRTCGMHVHVDVRDLSIDQIRNVLKAYGKFQDEINTILPISRRSNQYCRRLWSSLTEANYLQRLDACTTVGQMYQISNTRYMVINLRRFVETGTIEFRQHSGTVEADKAVYWARWCLAFVQTYKDIDVTQAAASDDGAMILKRIAARGEARTAARGLTAKLIKAMRQRPVSEAEISDWIAATPRCKGDVWGWLLYLAHQYGQSLEKVEAGWRIARPANAIIGSDRTPFQQCFDLFDGALGYFSQRRSQLA